VVLGHRIVRHRECDRPGIGQPAGLDDDVTPGSEPALFVVEQLGEGPWSSSRRSSVVFPDRRIKAPA
jgi:hypothetical protein